MKRKKHVWLTCLLCVTFLLVACENGENGEKIKEPVNEAEIITEDIKQTNDIEDVKKPEETFEPIDVAVLGAEWEKQKDVTFYKTDWKKEIPKDIRFVLIDMKEQITQEKQKTLQTWLEKDKVILFYGENVQPEEVKEKIGMEVGTIEVKTSASFDFPYLLYGYGYSMTYEQYLPIFLGSNTFDNFEEKIATFLLKNKNF